MQTQTRDLGSLVLMLRMHNDVTKSLSWQRRAATMHQYQELHKECSPRAWCHQSKLEPQLKCQAKETQKNLFNEQ